MNIRDLLDSMIWWYRQKYENTKDLDDKYHFESMGRMLVGYKLILPCNTYASYLVLAWKLSVNQDYNGRTSNQLFMRQQVLRELILLSDHFSVNSAADDVLGRACALFLVNTLLDNAYPQESVVTLEAERNAILKMLLCSD
jgi:hypothetical protein